MFEFVRLMNRDRALLEDIASFNVMSLEQIRRRHFSGLAASVCSERISKLQNAGFVSKQRVGTLIHHKAPKEIGVVVTLTQKGLGVVQDRKHFARNFRLKILNTTELPHDLLLIEIAEKLKEEHPKAEISTGERGDNNRNRSQIVPDLIAKIDGKSWAVELELTAKSSNRYRKIILDYLTSDFEKILYVVGNPAIATKLRRMLMEYLPPSEGYGRFEFKLLDEFLYRDTHPPKTNKTKEFYEKCL